MPITFSPLLSSLSNVSGKAINHLNYWMTGKASPPIDQLFRLAHLLGVKVNDLYIYEPEKTAGPCRIPATLRKVAVFFHKKGLTLSPSSVHICHA
jgi:transcriptional regulator with XRE-family HTH domain